MNELISIISIVVICHTVGFVIFVVLYHTYKCTTEISRNDIRCLELEYDLLKLEYNLLKLENEINDRENLIKIFPKYYIGKAMNMREYKEYKKKTADEIQQEA